MVPGGNVPGETYFLLMLLMGINFYLKNKWFYIKQGKIYASKISNLNATSLKQAASIGVTLQIYVAVLLDYLANTSHIYQHNIHLVKPTQNVVYNSLTPPITIHIVKIL